MTQPRVSYYEFGPFRLNVPERQLQRYGKEVSLTPKTLDLLLTLIENRGHLLTKTTLISLVWPDTFIEESNLAVQISMLRKTLGENDEGVEYIRTLPKRGYCFVADAREAFQAERVSIHVRSLAILPFEVTSSEAGDYYLGLGISDAITTRLNQISQIVVRPTNAAHKYAAGPQNPQQAGRELAAEAVLSGRVTRAGDRIRVTVQLVDVIDNRLLWADKLDHSFTDVFTYEDFISERVASALNLELTRDQFQRLTKRPTENSDAYWSYLKGRYHWKKRAPEDFKKAMEYFKYAGDKDPNYGLAYSGLADCYSLLNYYGLMPAKIGMEKAREAALKAVAADDGLAEAHASLALVKFWYEWDWLGAEISFRRALELNPSYATAQQWYCWFLVAMARHDESIAAGTRALELDPLTPASNMALGKSYFFSRCYDESIRQCQHTLELDPNFIPARFFLAQSYEQKGMFGEALTHYERAVELTGSFHLGRAIMAHALAASGDRRAAEQILSSLLELSESGKAYSPPYGIALIYAGLNDRGRAVDWLEKAFAERFIWLAYLEVDPVFDGLRQDFRFQQLLKRMQFPQPGNLTSPKLD
ncbi:MAG: winged helix-turn-helix domain-containing protein [Pyrinomonadaceae bacterium]